jgi:hypothetical protein
MAAFQPASGLRGLKRSWSGNASDLGADENGSAVSTAARSSLATPASSLLPGSSPGNPIEWSPSPEPEVRRSVLPPTQPCERDVANEPGASQPRSAPHVCRSHCTCRSGVWLAPARPRFGPGAAPQGDGQRGVWRSPPARRR